VSDIDILYADNHLLVVNKPAGLLTQPTDLNPESLEALCKQWVKQDKNKEGNIFLHAVHRLDKPASGILLFARTSKALSRLSKQMREKHCKKTYLACIDRPISQSEGILEHYLTHDHHHAKVYNHPVDDAKRSRLDYQIIHQQGPLSLLKIDLITGRYHQIRAQLSHIGCPIIGDLRYGNTKNLEVGLIALHHHQLVIAHPTLNTSLTFKAPLPNYWPLPLSDDKLKSEIGGIVFKTTSSVLNSSIIRSKACTSTGLS
jgi:23S rRNA pseudouridine1911/1915/1917 synthase